jgi:quinol monooxygenase YgiN
LAGETCLHLPPDFFYLHRSVLDGAFVLRDRDECGRRNGLRHQDKRSQAMSTTVTLINVFTAKPGKQQALANALAEGTRDFFSKQPGSLASSVVVGGDGGKVVNISQWRSAEDIAAFRGNPRFAEYVKTIVDLGAGETVMGHTVYAHEAGVEK